MGSSSRRVERRENGLDVLDGYGYRSVAACLEIGRVVLDVIRIPIRGIVVAEPSAHAIPRVTRLA